MLQRKEYTLSVPFSSGQWLLLRLLIPRLYIDLSRTFSPLFIGAMVATKGI